MIHNQKPSIVHNQKVVLTQQRIMMVSHRVMEPSRGLGNRKPQAFDEGLKMNRFKQLKALKNREHQTVDFNKLKKKTSR